MTGTHFQEAEEEETTDIGPLIDSLKCYIKRCPNEILFAVADYLYLEDQLDLCLVSRLFKYIGQDRIYREIQLRRPLDSYVKTIPCLLRTPSSQPHLAKIVKSLQIFPISREVQFDLADFLSMPFGALSLLPAESYFINEPILTGYLLTLLRGLRRLDIGVYLDPYDRNEDDDPYEEPWEVVYQPVSHPLSHLFGREMGDKDLHAIPGLQNLRELCFRGQRVQWEWLTLPLQRIHLYDKAYIMSPADGSVRASKTLKSIEVDIHCSILMPQSRDFDWLPATLRKVDNLEEFEIGFGHGNSIYGYRSRPTRTQYGHGDILVKSMATASSTLNFLLALPVEEDDMSYLDYIEPVTNLRHFTKLKHVAICQDILLGKQYEQSNSAPITSMLPPNLQRLEIWYPTVAAVTRWLQQLLALFNGGYLTSLEEISIHAGTCRGDDYEKFSYTKHMFPIWDQICDAGINVGIYVSDGYLNPDWEDEEYDPLALDIVQHLTLE
ncbi:hypothetical protein K491DRAFT_728571 [Lophiostoma macrostomum CBS 122681]|uniref:F-box domain-containing protein n=1 Tax=Lophiostoma macrostomum CBS 122681 TaxID=1314788 RepID=A0A6A6TK42_9PLEO|nr:hypothetical protein K491DRAFT_728571 [Lophiostoma macrostomum CBS 122681]